MGYLLAPLALAIFILFHPYYIDVYMVTPNAVSQYYVMQIMARMSLNKILPLEGSPFCWYDLLAFF